MVDEHLARCAACRSWADSAAEVTRRARLGLAVPVPDVTAAVLGRLPVSAPAAVPGRARRWVDAVVRLALLVVGAGQLAVSLPVLAGSGGGMTTPVHVAHETGAWNLGLAACFLGVAVLPRLAAGSLPFLLPFTAVLTWVTVSDLGAGHVHTGRAVGHLLLLAGAALVTLLALRNRTRRTGPMGAGRSRVGRDTTEDESGRPWTTATADGHADWPRDATASAEQRRAA
jgi:predicted anti-sigma-YlaC factor YlaD